MQLGVLVQDCLFEYFGMRQGLSGRNEVKATKA